jgi:hypothetical protein
MGWLIWSIEHGAWWRPAENGYTKLRYEAGRYSFDHACEIVASANKFAGDKPNEAMIEDEGR